MRENTNLHKGLIIAGTLMGMLSFGIIIGFILYLVGVFFLVRNAPMNTSNKLKWIVIPILISTLTGLLL